MRVNLPHSRRFIESARKTPLAALKPLLLTLVVTTSLGACAVGPEFRSPALQAEAGYRADALPGQTAVADGPTGDAQAFLQDAEVPRQWWMLFGNDELNRRVEQALVNSPTIASAQAALRQAQAQAGAARGGLWPSLDASLGANRRSDSVAGGALSDSPYTVHNASVEIGYKLDLFGGVRRGIEAENAVAQWRAHQLDGTYLSLAANVVTTSIREASLRAQIRATEEIVGVYAMQFDMISRDFDAGARAIGDVQTAQSQVATANAQLPALRDFDAGARAIGDVQTAQSQVATANAQLPALRKALHATQTQLATYLGRFPSEAELEALELDALKLPTDIPVSLPSNLVRQRPDVRAAEAQLHEATARLGVATANRFPNISLNASLGSQALQSDDLFGGSAAAWGLGLNLLQPIFRGGSLRAQQKAAEAGMDKAAADYRSTVLGAFQDVADSLRALELDAQSLAAQSNAQQASSSSLELARKQFDDGSVALLQVLDATRQYQQARLGVIEARATRLADTAALFTALGGGFGEADSRAQVDPAPASP